VLVAIEPRYDRVWRCIPTVYLDSTEELKVYNILKEFSSDWLSPNQLRILMELQTGHCHISGHLFKLGLVDNHRCDRCVQAIETTSHSLCNCETFTTLRFRHLGQHFMKPGGFEDITVSKILHFVQGTGLLNVWENRLHKRLIMVEVDRSLLGPPLCILFCSVLL